MGGPLQPHRVKRPSGRAQWASGGGLLSFTNYLSCRYLAENPYSEPGTEMQPLDLSGPASPDEFLPRLSPAGIGYKLLPLTGWAGRGPITGPHLIDHIDLWN
jgi:hypothetical protein